MQDSTTHLYFLKKMFQKTTAMNSSDKIGPLFSHYQPIEPFINNTKQKTTKKSIFAKTKELAIL